MSTESQTQINSRNRKFRIAAALSVIWWIVSIGGIITVIIMQS